MARGSSRRPSGRCDFGAMDPSRRAPANRLHAWLTHAASVVAWLLNPASRLHALVTRARVGIVVQPSRASAKLATSV